MQSDYGGGWVSVADNVLKGGFKESGPILKDLTTNK